VLLAEVLQRHLENVRGNVGRNVRRNCPEEIWGKCPREMSGENVRGEMSGKNPREKCSSGGGDGGGSSGCSSSGCNGSRIIVIPYLWLSSILGRCIRPMSPFVMKQKADCYPGLYFQLAVTLFLF